MATKPFQNGIRLRPPTGIKPSVVSLATNRVNSQGRSLGNVISRTSQFVANIIQPGETIPLSVTGLTFYFTVATAPLLARPGGGVFNEYGVGTGLELVEENSFELLELKNDNSFPVVFEVFIGFDKYIDKRLYLDTTSLPIVAFPTYDTPNSAANVNIEDKSAQVITDINGQDWYAISRIAIVISNTSTGVVLLLQEAGSVVANGPAIAAIQPATAFRLEVSGDYTINVGGGNIDAVVSELYQALMKTA